MAKFFKEMDYEKVREEEVFKGKRLNLKIEEYYNRRDDKLLYREHVKAGKAVVIMPFLTDDTLIMIEEVRTPIGKSILEFPAGMIEDGENPREAAIRELEEETGYRANCLEKVIHEYPAVGYSDEEIYIYRAKDLKKTKKNLDPTEDIKVHKITIEELKQLYEKGEICSSAELIALLSYLYKS